MSLIGIFLAILLDFIVGDPYNWPHPVKVMGNYIYLCMRLQERWRIPKYIFGLLLWLSTLFLTLVVSGALLWGAYKIHWSLYWLIWIYLSYTCLATKSLAGEARKVYQKLTTGTIEAARQQVAMIVGRETSKLSYQEISKATIETVAENTSDGVIGPLVCLFIGGPLFAMGYKAINTLDSMVGYPTEKYYKIGFVSAKIDDLANLIPARISWICLMIASHILQLNSSKAFRIGFRDRYQHTSPNSAFSEAVVAGALGIQLGGSHYYHGEIIHKPTIGDATREVVAEDILTTISLLYMSTMVAVLFFTILYMIVFYL